MRDISRIKKNGEVFTPLPLVNQMLDKLPAECWQKGKTVCDPACGTGNMLVPVLERKCGIHGHTPLQALKSIYGVDIMKDNIRECKTRLLKAAAQFGKIKAIHRAVVQQNIKWLDTKIYPKGALDYDFSF